MSTEQVIRISNLTKIYRSGFRARQVKALDSVSYDIRKGEVFGLLGPNGSGKTTTIKVLLGLLFPTAGTCTIFDKPPSDVEVKRRLGFLPEESYLYRFLNARETLDFYGALSGLTRSERTKRSEELISKVGLSDAATRPLREFSKGMARRMGLAACLIGDPELVILDEPTSGLDPIGTREIKDLILELKARGRTVLLSSHLLADVEDVCDRIAIMARGKLAALGPVSELLARTDRLEVVFNSMSPEEISDLTVYAQSHGHKILAVGKQRRKLEELFLEVVAEHARNASDSSNSSNHIS
ncbi:MAG: ABC transporter ATP-binding protein [Candidatus Brocadiia bacterium]